MTIENTAAVADTSTDTSQESTTTENNALGSNAGNEGDADLRKMFREMTAKPAESDEPVAAATKPVAKTAAPAVRAADGKFVKAPVLGAPAGEKNGTSADEGLVTDPAVAEVTETPEEKTAREAAENNAENTAAKPVVAPEHAKAPTSWKGSTQAKWDALDPEVKAEVHRREADFHKGIEGYRQLADLGKQFDAEFRPYEAMIRAGGTTPQQLVRNWMDTEYKLQQGSPDQKAALFVQYAGQYGLTPDMVTEAFAKAAEGRPAVDPQVAKLSAEVTNLKTQREQELRVAQQREQELIRSEVETFAKSAGHEHYEEVKLDMAAMLAEGRAKDMQEAYDKAIWVNPEVRKLLQTQQKEAESKLAADKAAAAKKAAQTNVTPRGTPPRTPVVGTIDDTLKSAYREIMSRNA